MINFHIYKTPKFRPHKTCKTRRVGLYDKTRVLCQPCIQNLEVKYRLRCFFLTKMLAQLNGHCMSGRCFAPGLPLGGRTPYITSKNRLHTPKLHIKDVPRSSENSLVRPKMDIETSCRQKKTRPHLPDYLIYVPPSYWKLIYFVY